MLVNSAVEKPKLLPERLCFRWQGHWDSQLLHEDARPAELWLGFQTRPGALGVTETLPVPLAERSIVIPRK